MASLRDLVFTILDTETVSAAVDKEHLDLMGLITPTNVTVAVHGCDTPGGTFGACKGQDQVALSYVLVANEPQPVKLDEIPWRFLKLVASVAVTGNLAIRPVFRDLSR